jgi:hypothetical protein
MEYFFSKQGPTLSAPHIGDKEKGWLSEATGGATGRRQGSPSSLNRESDPYRPHSVRINSCFCFSADLSTHEIMGQRPTVGQYTLGK